MDLRSPAPFWPCTDGEAIPRPPLAADAACDTAIIGAGITGAIIAHRLAKGAGGRPGRDCIILDKRAAARGSTLASTAIIQYEIDTHLLDLAKQIGEEGAARAYQLCRGAIDGLGRLVAGLPDRCGFARRPSLYLASEKKDVPTLEAEAAARRRIGIPCEFLGAREVAARYPFKKPAAILSPDAAQVDPYRLTHALLADAGVRLHDATEVVSYERTGRGFVLRTAAGPTVTARHLVITTGYECQTILKEKIADLKSTYALATAPIESFTGWERREIMWETSRPYFYLRTTDDGRALIGGEDEDFQDPDLRDALIPAKTAKLMKRFRDMFPAIDAAPEFAWAGTFGESKDGLAYAGESPEHPGALFALGLGGNGMTFSMVLASVIEDLIEGRPNDDARLFRFGR